MIQISVTISIINALIAFMIGLINSVMLTRPRYASYRASSSSWDE